MEIGDLVKNARKRKGYTQSELAKLIGTSYAEISRIETGIRKKISPDIMKKLSKHLDISTQELFEQAGYLEKPDTSAHEIDKNNYLYIGDLTPSQKTELENYAEYLKSHRK